MGRRRGRSDLTKSRSRSSAGSQTMERLGLTNWEKSSKTTSGPTPYSTTWYVVLLAASFLLDHLNSPDEFSLS